MRNKFEGVCYVCNQLVRSGTGHFERNMGKFRVKHALYSSSNTETCEEALRTMIKDINKCTG